MLHRHPEICLYQPEIPQNTGNIGRLAAGSGCKLNLIEPLGFSIDDKAVRRAGLDYWPYMQLSIHPDIQPLLQSMQPHVAFLSKWGERPYTDIPLTTKLLVFGRETSGLPDSLHQAYADAFYQIPLFQEEVRSLNLANSVAIVVYDQLWRRGLFPAASKASKNPLSGLESSPL